MSELKIPAAAYIAGEAGANEIWKDYTDIAPAYKTQERAIRAAAPIIVAAELRRIAKERLKTHDDISCMSLLQRADELDSQSVTK